MVDKKRSGRAIATEPCPECRAIGNDKSGNNLTTFDDGGKYCFACEAVTKSGFIQGDFYGLDADEGWLARAISIDTCRKANFRLGKYTGYLKDKKKQSHYVKDEWVQIATWKDEKGNLLAQKIRNSKKWFKFIGNAKDLDLWGIYDYQPNPEFPIIVTAGEIDRLSIMELKPNYAVVSPPSGEGSCYKACKRNLKRLLGYKFVILALDNDDAGQKAMQKCLELFEVHKVRVVTWSAKDANELLQAGKHKELISDLWKAKEIVPTSIGTVSDYIDRVLIQPKFGIPYKWDSWTKATYGRQKNTITTLVGATGIGKTEIVKDLVDDALANNINTAVFSFEQVPEDTIRRYVGSRIGVKIQKPGEKWDAELIRSEAMKYDQKLWLYNYEDKIDVGDIIRSIVYLVKAKDCRFIVIDNMKSLRIVLNKEECSEFSQSIRALAKNNDLEILLVSHVSKNAIRQSTHVGFSSKMRKGEKPHENLTDDFVKKTLSKFQLDWETGRMPTESDIEGGNDIAAISDYIFSIGRNKRADDEKERRTIKVNVVKCGRIDSEYGNMTFYLYRNDEGTLEEVEKNQVIDYTDEEDEEGLY